ncbi:MAG: hypothetical protein HZB41_15125 [Ignavibacteriae bacterium]|nr:hypothetical protein [Ignavibacteriota bacterium]
MAKTGFSQARRNSHTGIQHYLLWAILAVAFYVFFFFKVIPFGVANFVVPLFQPSGERLIKTGFVKFDGLVWASVPKDKEYLYKGKDLEVKKEYINKEFIFDFTYSQRNDNEHGYVKGATEFYAKTESLGENPIILEPWIGFWILALVLSLVCASLVTIVLPTNIGLLAILFDRQVDNTRAKIRLQTGFSDDIVDILIMPDDQLRERDWGEIDRAFRSVWDRTYIEDTTAKHHVKFEDLFNESTDIVTYRKEIAYGRIKEYFSDFVVKEIEDTKDGLIWRKNHFLIGKGLRVYMAHHFTEKYSNNVTGMAYGGAAFLIVAIGIRGLKFIPPTKPSFILLAIFLEFSMLLLLAVTLFYTEEEERMDRMLKKMEDANRSQLETLKGQQHDIHQLTNALVGQTAEIIKSRVEKAISEYMTSDSNVHKVVAEEISKKIMIGIKESFVEKK